LFLSSYSSVGPHEEEFLISLLHLERAGSKGLQKYWNNKVTQLRKQYLKVEK
jgi:hypothetical protein